MSSIFEKIQRKWCTVVLGAFVLFSNSVMAGYLSSYPVEGSCCNPCDNFCGNYYVEIEALYWKTMHDPIFVARRSSQTRGSDFVTNPKDELYHTGDWSWGVRGRLGYETCDWFADISYLYYASEDKRSEGLGGFNRLHIVGSPAFAGNETETFVASKAKFHYQNIDGRWGHFFYNQCQSNIFLYGNARGVKIDYDQHSRGIPSTSTTFDDYFIQEAEFRGGGLGMGIGSHYRFCGNFGIGGNAGILAVMGNTRYNFRSFYLQSSAPGTQETHLAKAENWWHMLPAFDFKVGIDYEFCWSCFNFGIEVGYELNYYANILRSHSENSMSLPSSERIPTLQQQDIGFGGPFVNVDISF